MNKPLIEVEKLSIVHKITGKILVNNVSFEINRGETLALVGESGAGKSLTAHSITCLNTDAMSVTGAIRFKGENLLKQKPEYLQNLRGDGIGMIFQEPMSSLNPLQTVGKQVQENLTQHQLITLEEASLKTLQLFKDVELPTPEILSLRLPHELSGGQRQRVMIAMAIANQPDLLIADEPTTALDVTVQQQVLILLKKLQQQYDMAILFITHDMGLIKNFADHMCVMTSGNIVEKGLTKNVFRYPQHPVTCEIIESEPTGEPYPIKETTPSILTTSNLSAWYKQRKKWFSAKTVDPVFEQVSLNLRQGETLGLVGESGSGKTSIALALLRLIKTDGNIQFKNDLVHNLKEHQFRPLRKDIQMVFQDPFGSLNPRLSIRNIVEEGLIIHTDLDKHQRARKVQDTLAEVELPCSSLDLYPHEFSGGQRQRIALARAMILQPDLLILDEPTSSLDRGLQLQLINLLRKLQRQHGTSYIFISHDLSVVKAMSHQIAVMKGGKIVEYGTTLSVLNDPKHLYTQQLVQAAFHQSPDY